MSECLHFEGMHFGGRFLTLLSAPNSLSIYALCHLQDGNHTHSHSYGEVEGCPGCLFREGKHANKQGEQVDIIIAQPLRIAPE